MSLFMVLGIIVLVLVIVALSAIRVVQQYERGEVSVPVPQNGSRPLETAQPL
jgi:hypothetical protein